MNRFSYFQVLLSRFVATHTNTHEIRAISSVSRVYRRQEN